MSERRNPVPLYATDEQIAVDTPLRLQEAVRFGFPRGNMTVSGLRREIERGNLDAFLIAGRYFTTLAAIRTMMDRCRVAAPPHDSGSAPQPPIAPPSGGSRTADIEKAQAAAQARLRALSEHCGTI